ncbi:hypothetical protein NliqN6_5197 [Naganishia liquefaciens]|uniref:DUF2461 domain-containing protein n=1 Tax=Naganishia liquefaciens TaxID=104408 RepID=A0A8H3YGF3_9TREE|nr:hypothetical protein NliqN6_5197 [Naganishia liquefaciens]
MSSRRTSTRTRTVTPGRSVTTLKNFGTKSASTAKGVAPRKNGKAISGKPNKDDVRSATESQDSTSEDDPEDEDEYEESDGDVAIEEEDSETEDMESDDIDEPSSKRGTSKRKVPAKGKANGSSATTAKRQKISAKGKAVVKPVKAGSAGAKDIKTKPKIGDNYPDPAASESEGGEASEENDYSSYSEGDGESDESIELEEGQEIKGRIFSAPKTGHVPPGQISRNTFKFLVNLQDPEKNDREWFKSREPAYRLAEQEWKDFVSILTNRFREVDRELPILPPKDLIHRIYRDVRFSNDKTPYKKHFSMSISRSGRKGIWAGYFVSVQPRGRSLIAGGIWAPGKNELASIRHAIKTDSSELRNIISAPDFTKLFGPASPDGKGKGARCNVFGHDDQLKVAPKGVAKDHPDIDLLKLRSVAVVKNFRDEEVNSPEFMDILLLVASKIVPLVHYLNSAIALPAPAAEAA